MKTRFLHALIAVATMAVAMPSYAAEAVGVVGALQGSASAQSTSGARALKVGDQVFLDEEVTTDAGSKLQLMLTDRSTITLNPNSKVKVKEFAYDANSDSGSLAMEGVKGAFRFIGGALSKQNPVTIKTPVSSIGIRGGIADTHIAANGATDAIFLFGDAMTMTNQNGQTTVVTTPGQGLSMVTPTDVPTFTPPSVVQQHLGSFDPSPTGSAAAPGDTTPGDTTAGDTTSGDTSGLSDSTQQTEGDRDTASNSTEGEASESDRANYGSFANSGSDPNAPGGATTTGDTRGGVVVGNAPGAPGDLNATAANTTTTASTSTRAGTQTLTILNNDWTGRYSKQNGTGGNRETGSLGVTKSGTDFIVTANEEFPNTTTHSGKLPVVGAAGYNAITTPFQLDPLETDLYTGFAYTTPSMNSFYYHMVNTSGEIVNAFFGRQLGTGYLNTAMANTAALSGTEGTEGISYYMFAPDIISYEGRANTPLGFFDYGIKDISGNNIVNDHGRTGMTPFGIAMDYTNSRFLSGAIHWGPSTAGSRDLVMAFGKINNAPGATGPFLTGANFQFLKSGLVPNQSGTTSGTIATSDNVFYGDGNGRIESFVVQGQAPQGYRIETPALRVDPGTIAVTTVDETRHGTTKTLQGFSAGHMVTTVNGNYNVDRMVSSTDPTGVEITVDPGTSNVSGTISLEKQGTPAVTAVGNFGGAGTSSAYLSRDLYAAQQGSVQLTDGVNAARTDTSGKGFIVNASEISDVNACRTCEYAHWGVWAGETSTTLQGSGGTAHTVAAVPYVAGEITQNLNGISGLPAGQVTYNGTLIGSEHNPTANTLDRVTGSFTSGINLGLRQVESFTINNVGSITTPMNMTGGPVNINVTNDALFNNIVLTGTGVSGVVNGALFGPMAENVGGNYIVNSTSVNGAGVFIGTR